MPFPFLPGGAILAVAVLVGALTIFGLVLMAMDRAAGRAVGFVRGSMLPGIVAGWHGWSPHAGLPGAAPRPSSPTEPDIVDVD